MKIHKEIKRVFFIGIGGIGMSALARYLRNKGIEVYGYDSVQTVLTKKLENEGMNIHYEDRVELIPEHVDFVVYTPAIPEDHKEKNWFIDNGYQLYKRSELLKDILEESHVIAVAGTHGKTSTSAVLSHLLYDSAASATCFVGGIMVNYDSNFLYSESDWVIVEADEFDRSFLRLFPDIAIIQALDPDHLDIYGTAEEMILNYRAFTAQIKEGGMLVVPGQVKHEMSKSWKIDLERRNISLVAYGEGQDECDIISVKSTGLSTYVQFHLGDELVEMTVPFPGKHNAMNSIGAAVVAKHLGLTWNEISGKMNSFLGIKRRFEVIHRSDDLVFVDDYAHHPEEIKAMVSSLKSCFPGKNLTGVFQPHLYTRTKDFVEEFAEELDRLDQIILLPIYPARELPIKGVQSEIILNRMKNPNKLILEKDELINHLKKQKIEVLVTLGAGDIDKLVPLIKKEIFEN